MKLVPLELTEKLQISGSKNPYIVLEQILNQPVFKVKPIDDDNESNMRTLHHNMLFPIQSAQEEQEDVPTVQSNLALQKANLLMDAYFDSY